MGEPSEATEAFLPDRELLERALEWLVDPPAGPGSVDQLPAELPQNGIGPAAALEQLAPLALGRQARLTDPVSASRMASPTPWVTWATAEWTAARSDNLLDQDTLPGVVDLQERVMSWLAPLWGMSAGHLVPGATVANLTALWAARDSAGATRIVTSEAANGSIAKIARVLAMSLLSLPTDDQERLDMDAFVDFARRDPDGMTRTAVVLTAGTHNVGGVDPLRAAHRTISSLGIRPAWWHVDASWAGGLMLSQRHSQVLNGIQSADSVTVSAHKLMFQPAESALVMFRDPDRANQTLEFAGPGHTSQVGLLGSRQDRSLNLAMLLLAYGKLGVAEWIDRAMSSLSQVADGLRGRDDVEVFGFSSTGILLWRPKNLDVDDVRGRLGTLSASEAYAAGSRWIRHIAANPLMEPSAMLAIIDAALANTP